MSDTVYCDGCGQPGRRLIAREAPRGWLVLEVPHEDEDGAGYEAGLVYSCSSECVDLIASRWRPGRGYVKGPAHPRFGRKS